MASATSWSESKSEAVRDVPAARAPAAAVRATPTPSRTDVARRPVLATDDLVLVPARYIDHCALLW